MAKAERHDGVTIALHWATAALVVFQFLSAEFWDDFPHPTKHLLIITHMSLGIVLAGVLLARIAWRLMPHRHLAAAGAGLLGLAARGMHAALYTLLAAEMVLGVFTRWTDNHPLNVFGLLIPSPLGVCTRSTGHFVDQIHDINAWTIMVLAAAHAGIALVHHYMWRDDVLRRMLPGR
jgi:cytochrome b561